MNFNDKSGLLQKYTDWNGNIALRYWVTSRILCGGTILDLNDFRIIQNNNGITGVLSAESQGSDEGKCDSSRLHVPFHDDGQSVPEDLIHRALDFALGHLGADHTNVLYVHCALGGSRGPSMAYAVCRGVLGLEPEDVFRLISEGNPGFEASTKTGTPTRYILSIEEALKTWKLNEDKTT